MCQSCGLVAGYCQGSILAVTYDGSNDNDTGKDCKSKLRKPHRLLARPYGSAPMGNYLEAYALTRRPLELLPRLALSFRRPRGADFRNEVDVAIVRNFNSRTTVY